MGEPAGTGDCMEILAGPRKGGDGGPRRFLLPIVGLEEFPNLLTPLGKKRDLATALEGGGTGQKSHVAPDV